MPVDHTSITAPSEKYKEVVDWYIAALEPLGYKKVMDFGVACGLGDPHPDFWLGSSEVAKGEAGNASLPVHTAFRAKDRATVDKFYEAAIKAGGKDNGKPGVRQMYHPNYYGAFVLDPLGNNIEAVCHTEEK